MLRACAESYPSPQPGLGAFEREIFEDTDRRDRNAPLVVVIRDRKFVL